MDISNFVTKDNTLTYRGLAGIYTIIKTGDNYTVELKECTKEENLSEAIEYIEAKESIYEGN